MRRQLAIIFVLAAFLAASSSEALEVSGFTDIDFGTWSGSGISRTLTLCIYDPVVSNYSVSAGSGPFRLTKIGGSGAYIDYDVSWRDTSGGWYSLRANTPASFTGASQTLDCGGGTNATVKFSIRDIDLRAAPAGNYSGSIFFEILAQ